MSTKPGEGQALTLRGEPSHLTVKLAPCCMRYSGRTLRTSSDVRYVGWETLMVTVTPTTWSPRWVHCFPAEKVMCVVSQAPLVAFYTR